MAPVLKTGIPERVSGVRIPPSPPFTHCVSTVLTRGQFEDLIFRAQNMFLQQLTGERGIARANRVQGLNVLAGGQFTEVVNIDRGAPDSSEFALRSKYFRMRQRGFVHVRSRCPSGGITSGHPPISYTQAGVACL